MRVSRTHASTFSLLTAITLLSACSKPMTCALEGCSSNESVSLASDYTSADAMAQSKSEDDKLHEKIQKVEGEADKINAKDSANQAATEKKISDILNRLGLSEALATLHAETLVTHDKRLLLLETKSAETSTALSQIRSSLLDHESRIIANESELLRLNADLSAQLAVLAAADQAQIDKFNADLAALNATLSAQISGLSAEMATEISSLVQKMTALRQELFSNDQAVAAAAALSLAELQTQLDAEVATLSAADQANLDLTIQQISQLDGKVNAVIFTGVMVAIKVQNQIHDLKAEIRKLDAADEANYKKLNAKIKDLNADLHAHVAQLQGVDKALAKRILGLENANEVLRADHEALESAFVAFKALQESFNAQILADTASLGSSIGQLKIDISARIDAEVDALEGAMAEIVKESTLALSNSLATINGKIDLINAAIKDLEKNLGKTDAEVGTIKTSLQDLRKDYEAKVADLAKDIKALEKLIEAKSCKIGPEKKVTFDHDYRSADCDGVKFDVLVR